MRFGEQLQQYIKESGSSVSKFAEKIAYNRAGIYSIFNGTRRMPREAFEKMIYSCEFNDMQKNQLRELYLNEAYAPDVLERILCIKEHLAQMDKTPFVRVLPEFSPQAETQSLSGSQAILSAIEFIFKDELKCETPKISTNFSFTNKKLTDRIFNLVNGRHGQLDFRHIVRLGKNSEGADNLNTLLYALKFARAGFKTDCIDCEQTRAGQDIMFPFFLISSRYALHFNPEEHIAIFNSSKTVIRSAQEMFTLLHAKTRPLVYFSENVLDMKVTLEDSMQMQDLFAIADNPCVSMLMTPEIIRRIAKEDIPYREMLISSFSHHCELLQKLNCTEILSQSGFFELLNSGRVSEIPECLVKRFTQEEISALLKQQLKLFENSKNNKTYLLNPNGFSLPHGFYIALNGRYVLICSENPLKEKSYVAELSINLTSGRIAADLKAFIDYLIECGFCYTDDQTHYFLQDMVIQSEALEKKQTAK